MISLRFSAFAFALILGVTSLAGSARASLMYNLDLSGDDISASGTIELPSAPLVGTDRTEVISFSLDGTGALGSFSFGLADIDAIDWVIDAVSLTLSFNQFVLSNVINSDGVGTCLFSIPGSCTAVSAGGQGFTHVFNAAVQASYLVQGGDYFGRAIPAQLTTALVAVPEPASLLLFLSGLLGIGIAWRRKPSSQISA